MRLMGSFTAVAVLAGLALPSAARPESHQHVRQGWLLGLGFGGGSAAVSDDSGSSDRQGGFAGSLRVGYAFTPEVSLELNSNAWIREESGTTVSFSVAAVALNYYPGAAGLVLRGGVGVGTVDVSTSFGPGTISASETGLGLTGGAAYEFRVTQRVALGPQIDFAWTNQQGFNTNHINGGLAVTWYFIPR